MPSPDGFVEFATAHAARLRRTAYLLCGDWYTAQDLTQTALAKLFVAWERVNKSDSVAAYAQRTLVNAYLSHKRRRSSGEAPTETLPDSAVAAATPELAIVLRSALAGLSPKARAVVVLRYWADLSVDETAAMLGMSSSAVKAQSMRALEQLRTALGPAHQDLVHNL